MTDHYVLFGRPIRHSRSPAIHAAFARATGQDLDYGIVEPEEDGFEAEVAAFRAAGGRGANVTAPFKLRAIALADDCSPAARMAGAANCLTFLPTGIRADNFDGIGLVRDIEVNLGLPLTGRRVLLLGAGGAARGAALPILEAGPRELVIANRHPERADEMRARLEGHGHAVSVAPGAIAGAFDIVLNATSASLTGECPQVPEAAFQGAALAYDLSYAKGLTPFLQRAQAGGAQMLSDGVGMLVEQAAEAFALWRGLRPGTGAMIAAIAAETGAIRP
ncbi:shikimate dehydrogenase [Paracoccus sp. (in: a-proteobacteria)]|uniref:shikimate dehydrogenase n=1 Tax=Paracoccus sp. TaxID=267 RepID=UPI0032203613